MVARERQRAPLDARPGTVGRWRRATRRAGGGRRGRAARGLRPGVDAARQTLEDAGFDVDLRKAPNYLGIGYVYRVDPPSGSMVPKGSTITLFII